MSIFNQDFFVCYLRVAQGCNLNCTHCFTLGNKDRIDFIQPETAERLIRVIKERINPQKIVFYIHGGETFMAPFKHLEKIFQTIQLYFGDKAIIIPQTNLLVKVNKEFVRLIKTYCRNHVGVSWDHKIRFTTGKQEDRFFKNLGFLTDNDVRYSISITLHKYLIDETDPIEVLSKFKHASTIDFEYLTVFDDKTRMLNQMDMKRYYWYLEQIYNVYLTTNTNYSLPFIDLVYKDVKAGKFTNCKCNCCNERTITMNVNQSVGLCPDYAYIQPISTISEMENDWTAFEQKALNTIVARKVTEFNPICMKCPSYEMCGGNCDLGLIREDGCFINDVLIQNVKKDRDKWATRMKFDNYVELNQVAH